MTPSVQLLRLTALCLTLLFLMVGRTVGQTTDTINGSSINTYMEATGYNACEQYVTGDTTGTNLTPGDRILLIQMKGCWVNEDSADYGQVTTYGSCGAYEFNTVESITEEVGNPGHFLIYFVAPPLNLYEAGQAKRFQVLRVPQYENVVIDTSGGYDPLSPPAWNGSVYGVLAFEASGWVEILVPINADGDGFRGGASSSEGAHVNLMDVAYINGEKGGTKGEGAYEIPPILFLGNPPQAPAYGMGPHANGAGGGNGMNAGGGGGGNGGRGGRGGYQNYQDSLLNIGGWGGWKAPYATSLVSRAFLGGGGGGGQVNDDADNVSASLGEGTQGGGIIIIRAEELKSNGSGISANGTGADSSNFDGAGGGGAGGVILLDVVTLHAPTNGSPLPLSVIGGDGGSAWGGSDTCHGPGGGGAGGFVGLSGPQTWQTVDSTVSVNLAGGDPGYAVYCTAISDSTYGARGGYSGYLKFGHALPGYFE